MGPSVIQPLCTVKKFLILLVLGAAGSGIGALGKFVRLQVGNSFALAQKGVDVTKLTAALGQVETGAKTLAFAASAGGLVTGNVLVLHQLRRIEEQELSGAITHTEARRQSAEVLFHGLLSNILFIQGLRTPITPLPEASLTKAQGVAPLPITAQPGASPTAGGALPPEPPSSTARPSQSPTLPSKPTMDPLGVRRAATPLAVGIVLATGAPETGETKKKETASEIQAATGTDGTAQAQKAATDTPKQQGPLPTMMSGNQKSGVGSNDTATSASAQATAADARELAPGSQGPALGSESTGEGTFNQIQGLQYESNPKHKPYRIGDIGAEPTDGARTLQRSVQVSSTSSRRIGVDPVTNEIVVFDEHLKGIFHGHVRQWTELTPRMQRALIQAGFTNRRGRIINGK